MGRSRLTRSPRFSEPSADTRIVSGETSMLTPSGSAETTVRQTPFTASESPGVSADDRSVFRRTRNPAGVGFTSAISPMVSMSPVNMLHAPLYKDIGAEPPGPAGFQPVPGESPLTNPVDSQGAYTSRSDIEVHRVDHSGIERGAMQRGAPLQHEGGDPRAVVKSGKRRREIVGWKGEDSCARVGQGLGLRAGGAARPRARGDSERARAALPQH